MRMIHEKFEDDDVGNHLADFKSAIGGLEANQQRTSHQKLSAHFEGDIHTKLNNSVSKICKRTFSSSPPYKPVKPEIPTHIKPEDFPNVVAFVMKLQQYHSDYNITNMHNELKEKAYQLKLQEGYSAKAQAARDRNDTAGAEEYERLASEAGEKAEEHAGLAKRMADYEIYWRGKKAEYLKKKKEEEEGK